MHSNDIEEARRYAFLLLKFRLRSEKELYQRLKRKKFSEETIRQTIGFLKEKKFINDNEFAGMWVASRIKRPLGLRRIKEELSLKGIDKEIVDAQIAQIKQGYREEEVVSRIARERIARLRGIEPYKAKSRLFSYLLRRGFSPEVITDVINGLLS